MPHSKGRAKNALPFFIKANPANNSGPSSIGIAAVHSARPFDYNKLAIDAVEPTDADGPGDSVPIEETLSNSIAHEKECIDA